MAMVAVLPGGSTSWIGSSQLASGAALLRAQLYPMLQPLLHLGLDAAPGRNIELSPGHAVREIILTGERFGGAVVVRIPGAVALLLHEARWRVEDVFGRRQTTLLLGGAHGRTKCKVGGIGLGSRR